MSEQQKQALLLLVGGRQMPNFLTAQYLRPNIVIPIASPEAMRDNEAWSKIEPSLRQLNLQIEVPKVVDAFDLSALKTASAEVVKSFPDVEKWRFNVTCGTSVMSIAAYEVAKELGLDAWYLDTDSRRVAVLNGNGPKGDLFQVSLADYLHNYGRKISKPSSWHTREELRQLARHFAQPNSAISALQPQLAKALESKNIRGGQRVAVKVTPANQEVADLYRIVAGAGLFTDWQEKAESVRFLLDNNCWEFLNGGWLELFVWLVAQDCECFDDSNYSFVIPADGAENEVDFALTYSGTLLIAECKTDAKPFKSNYLTKLSSLATLLGNNFVGRLLITNQMADKTNANYVSFCNQAKTRQVVVVDGEQLSDLGTILRREAGVAPLRSTYFRG